MKEIFDAVILICIFGFICVLVYYTTRFVSVKSVSMSQGKYLKVIDRVVLSKDKQLIIVEIGQECHLISMSAQNVQQLCVIDKEDLVLNEPIKLNVTNDAVQNMIDKILSLIKDTYGKVKLKNLTVTKKQTEKTEDTENLQQLFAKIDMRKRTLKENIKNSSVDTEFDFKLGKMGNEDNNGGSEKIKI
ncbi:MAG: flagellar biosynthetic protein FliO [Bacillota bacterium]|nr:flagellar biosynthetic protein FliO [Bacillota bacterium]